MGRIRGILRRLGIVDPVRFHNHYHRGQRDVILRKLRAGWYEHLRTKPTWSLSLEEKEFLRKYKKTAPDGFGSGKEVCYEAAV